MAQTITDALPDAQIARLTLELVAARGASKSICPSEVARALSADAARWRALMPQVRTVAYQLAAQQRLRITQRGQPINLQAAPARGAIRLTVWQMGAVVATADTAPQQVLPIDAQAPSE